MKKIKVVLSMMLVLLITFAAVSSIGLAAFAAGDYSYLSYEIKNGQVTITGCDRSKTGAVTIPGTLSGSQVTEISGGAFYYCESITSVTIPASVSNIGDGTTPFRGCASLTKISVNSKNNNYSSDSNGVLFDKEKTLLIQYPAGSTTKTYTVPEGVTAIGELAFYCCDRLENLTFPNSLKTIDTLALSGAAKITSLTIPNSVTEIGYRSVEGCASLKKVVISDNVKSIPVRSFAFCDALEDVSIGSGVQVIESMAFMDCISLKKITIPGNVAAIDSSAFYGCKNLNTLTLSDGVKSIDKCAFYDCKNLKSIFIPASVTSIGETAFGYYSGSGSTDKKVSGFTIRCYKDTIAKQYAVDNGFSYQLLLGVQADDLTINYKASAAINPTIIEAGSAYTVTYESSDPSIVTVDENGTVTGNKRGTAKITVTVKDQLGNTAEDTCTVTVKFSFIQKLIYIFLLGWLWY